MTFVLSHVMVLFILALAGQCSRYNIVLKDWTFRLSNTTQDYPANIPSSLSLDLIENRLVANDPYYRDNFLSFYKFQTQNVTYQTIFNIPSIYLTSKHQQLIFHGLDTHSTIFLNNKSILSTNNMFRSYTVDVQLNKSNILTINFTSSALYDIQMQKQFKDNNGFQLPQNYSWTRKAAYQYGWDWGPRILTMGIWKNVTLSLYNDSSFNNIRFTHKPILKTTKQLQCFLNIQILQLNQQHQYNLIILVTKHITNDILHNQTILLKYVANVDLFIPFTIVNNIWDYVWWTWDLGVPNLININLTLTNINTTDFIEYHIITGIRTINVSQVHDQSSNATSFIFNLNGYDIYLRGGNYIPPQMSLARTTINTYNRIINDALFGRFNTLRVWGGGQFQKDQFYDAVDKAGIILWHDLMFACALYPSNDAILTNIEQQLRDNIRRIRHHPSIALWNGNNEVWIGWQQWGWQDGLTAQQKSLVQLMYSNIFRKLLPTVLKQQHPQIFYWQTSPSVSSSTTKTISSGDIHFWQVWAAGSDIEQYQQYIGRFNSEYGMQAMPEMSSLQQFTQSTDLNIDSEILKLHQRHPVGNTLLKNYTYSYVGITNNLTRYSYYSQIMQAYALETAISSLRLNKPYNMGSLYWQINDVWPVTSWATVDYYGTYKAAHYRVRQLYSQLLIHVLHDRTSETYTAYIVNDHNLTFNCRCTISLLAYSGQTAAISHTVEKTVKPFERVQAYRFTKTQLSKYMLTHFVNLQLVTTNGHQSYNNYFFTRMAKRQNAWPDLRYNIDGTKLRLTAKKIASYVWIYRIKNGRYLPMQLLDNFFILLPNEEKMIDIGDVPKEEVFVTCYQNQWALEKDTVQIVIE